MIRAIVLAVLVTAAALVSGAAAAAPPNIVFMISDDQRWDAVGVVQRRLGNGRFPFFETATPGIDRIAAGGVWFNNAFVVHSLCSPSRAAFFTGQYSHTHGIANNKLPLPATTRTYATLLRAAGYRTGYFGKWHMGEQAERPGFDVHASFLGQGRYVDTPFLVNGVPTPTTGWVDDVSTTYALDFIRANAAAGRPFMMVLGFKAPHAPYDATSAPPRTGGLFPAVVADRPPNATSYPPYVAVRQPSDLTDEQYRIYFRTIAGLDANVGRVLDALDTAGVAADTMVIFTSDNGFNLGEHASPNRLNRDGEKRNAYEASMRVPLFIRYPRLLPGGTTNPAQVLNIDLAPTLLELAGLPPAAGMQGQSWVPLFDGRATQVRRDFFFEYFRAREAPGVPRIIAFRRFPWKLIEYPDYPEYGRELYNVRLDPWETRNRIADPTVQPTLDRMTQAMRDAGNRLGYRIPPGLDPQR